MSRPNLADRAERQAYRHELMRLHREWRWFGLALLLIAAWLLVWPRMGGPWMLGSLPMQYWGFGLMAIAWIILISVIVRRTRYHKSRMGEVADAGSR